MENNINNSIDDIDNLNIGKNKFFGRTKKLLINFIKSSRIYLVDNILKIIFLLIVIIIVSIQYHRVTIKNIKILLKENIKILNNQNSILNQQIDTIFSYLYNINNESSIYQLLKPQDVFGKKKVRIGKKGDGGYVLLNDFDNIKIAYSFGICDDVSFDKELADKNIDVYMYDHTIKNLPYQNPKFHWKKIGLTGHKKKNDNMETLKELLIENGHIKEKNMILKIDIERSEWSVFNEVSTGILKQFKYIVIEFHFNNTFASEYIKVFRKLNKNHQIFHLHCNNCGGITKFDGYNICSSLEISFVIRENNSFLKPTEYFPINNIDYKNCENKFDINNFLNIYHINNIYKN